MTDRGARPARATAPETAQAALRGLCPRCGAPTLFAGMLRFAPKCRACGLDFSGFNVGDGPAALITLVLGAVIVILALVVEFGLHPPLWVHALLWLPLTIASVIAALRVTKAALLVLEHRNAAREGRIVEPGP